MSPRSIDLCASYASPQRPPEEQLPKQSLRFTLMQGKPSLLRDSVPGARQEAPQSSALRLCRPPLRYAPSTPLIAPFKGWGTPPLALAAPAGVGQGGVFRIKWRIISELFGVVSTRAAAIRAR